MGLRHYKGLHRPEYDPRFHQGFADAQYVEHLNCYQEERAMSVTRLQVSGWAQDYYLAPAQMPTDLFQQAKRPEPPFLDQSEGQCYLGVFGSRTDVSRCER